jgi:primosomal protein N' (replication factor Y)
MLAKGHHFPNLSLVAIVDIDSALYSSDFRTIERMGQLITQVAGRAGRAELPGHVILQTQHPDHPLLTILLNEGYHALCNILLEERKLSMLPPFSYQVLFKASSKYPLYALNFLSWLKKQNVKHPNGTLVKMLGPIPSPIEKKANYFRAQLLLQSNKRQYLHQICKAIINKIDSYYNLNKIRWSIDVDPLDFY